MTSHHAGWRNGNKLCIYESIYFIYTRISYKKKERECDERCVARELVVRVSGEVHHFALCTCIGCTRKNHDLRNPPT